MIVGLFGRPYVDLQPLLEPSLGLAEGGLRSTLAALHEEICLGLAEAPLDYTGGSHRSMAIMPPSRQAEAHADYGEVIARMDPGQYRTLRALADDPDSFPEEPAAGAFGEERPHPLSRRQMLWLEHRFGVYFPWKVYFEMIPNRRWEEKSHSAGKQFTRLAKSFFPKTVAFVKSLPFVEIGRCNIMGLSANDHGTVHRDGEHGEHGEKPAPDHFMSFCPAENKRLFLWDEEGQRSVPVRGGAYWFNDSDYHGVEADPYFRYSLRVDGVFQPAFLEAISRGTA